jgi:hypothetical protein
MTTYSNPRMEAVITGWPYNRTERTTATFRVEIASPCRERGTRFTIDPKTGKPSAVKALTYASKVRIVDGDDGKTYIAELNAGYLMISIMQSNMKFQQESISSTDPRYSELMKLFSASALTV